LLPQIGSCPFQFSATQWSGSDGSAARTACPDRRTQFAQATRSVPDDLSSADRGAGDDPVTREQGAFFRGDLVRASVVDSTGRAAFSSWHGTSFRIRCGRRRSARERLTAHPSLGLLAEVRTGRSQSERIHGPALQEVADATGLHDSTVSRIAERVADEKAMHLRFSF